MQEIEFHTPTDSLDFPDFSDLTRQMLQRMGEQPDREGLLQTPKRFSHAISFLTSGYQRDVHEVAGNAIFNEPSSDLVLVKNIEFFSLCEHHILPFFGQAHVAYIPNGKIIGLSKIPRIVDIFARRLQIQERLTREIAEAINELIEPKGVAVLLEASHLCMMMRGVEKQQSTTITKKWIGDFRVKENYRNEILNLMRT